MILVLTSVTLAMLTKTGSDCFACFAREEEEDKMLEAMIKKKGKKNEVQSFRLPSLRCSCSLQNDALILLFNY